MIAPQGSGVKPGNFLELGAVRVHVVESYNRPELYANNPPHPKGLGVGYVLEYPTGLVVYFTGDTNFIDEMLELERRVTLFIPAISGGCVMTPEEAVEAVKSLKPPLTIPVHYENLHLYYRFRDMAQPYTQVVRLS